LPYETVIILSPAVVLPPLRASPWSWRLQIVLTLIAAALFARLSVRYVGESVFLADQVDQLQNFERLLQFEPDGLWGPIYGQTDPPARTFGPLGGVLAGVPVRLGLGADGSHAVTSLLLVLATMAAFLALLRHDAPLAWCWLMAFLASIVVWWNVGMQWSNTVLPSVGCAALCGMVLALRRPGVARSVALVLVVMFGLHMHLVALPVAVAVGVVLLVTLRAAWRRWPSRGVTVALAALVVLAAGPYLVAELMTGFANSTAVLGHSPGSQVADPAIGRASAVQVLQLAADPSGFWASVGIEGGPAVLLATLIALAAFVAWAMTARSGVRSGQSGPGPANMVAWLILASVLAIAAQAAFFIAVNRELLGRHYTAVLAPFYVLPPAALAAWALRYLPDRLQPALGPVLGAACVVLLLVRGPVWAERYHERTDWTYTRIHDAISLLCGTGTARTFEGPGFVTHAPGHDPVLQFLMTRRFVDCRYDSSADRLIAAGVDLDFPPERVEADGTFHLERVIPPGIASYRRGPP
jgi:hypothetical protein